MTEEPIAAGKSTFDLIDSAALFDELHLERIHAMADLACGVGNYSIAASKRIGKDGVIYAMDLWREGIDALRKKIASQGIQNIQASVVDISKHIPIEGHTVDLCLMATVLHDLIEVGTEEGTLKEVRRILRPEGILAIVEFKKVEGPPGPPMRIRLLPEELERVVSPYGFRRKTMISISPFHYLSTFSAPEGS